MKNMTRKQGSTRGPTQNFCIQISEETVQAIRIQAILEKKSTSGMAEEALLFFLESKKKK